LALIEKIVQKNLRGKLLLQNDYGAVTVIEFNGSGVNGEGERSGRGEMVNG
jgi:hypothetical protein